MACVKCVVMFMLKSLKAEVRVRGIRSGAEVG
jgi:hypothetical protein